MARQTVVLGAGMVGVSIAWQLQKRGHQVTLVDRRQPGRETSFGNAGIIQREAVRPYPFPRDMKTILSVLPNRRVDIRYRPAGMVNAASPLLSYWHHSSSRLYKKIVPEYASLIQLCLDAHGPMIEAAKADHLVRKEGWLEIYRTQAKLDKRIQEAKEARELYGVEFAVLNRAALSVKEPQLGDDIIGAIHWLDPWTVADPGGLVAAYATSFEAMGGELLQADITGVTQHGERWTVTTNAASLEVDQVVMALGPWAGQWMKPLGYHFPTFVKRGYHMHYATQPEAKLNYWLMDAEVGYLLAPMNAGVRLTTGAELDRLESPADEEQLGAAEKVARSIFPLGERKDSAAWKGARPCLPDMKPVIGPASRHPGLWLAFGHGHQGFTLGPATGQLLADMMENKPTAIDMSPFRADRF
ncbi:MULTISPECIES: FAD-dependent oxidoreductase [unclassified Halomonas]|uniref:NAD(P)/FAD-dependent oxidoreductase n=1 Tax=unclassified Halomonas TaxID=2609666 RepID=UPI001EF72F1F|nr:MULTISPECIES: FAD-dependent oxidoreductase [unclassified Halomonas]MCG7575313.1 FAD-binding oxidoreductase [Halomonas sp. MMH1-48]MCG7602375.1 FAD-binding oxidoreductase [Halomonas sp. MM17-34]MCG7611867.1 FAD-binding oxidoreductase [Halomonas sp. MM17-29]MCG7618748.1 FAD-binding oxidoreductase [Halomonas sp. DSH1-27]